MAVTRKIALAAAALALAGCATTATAVNTSGGPLGRRDLGGGHCFGFYPGETLTTGMVGLTNGSRHPVTITGVRVTGLRHMTVDAVYAYVINNRGTNTMGDEYGWPLRSQRHPAVGAVIPAGAGEQVLTVITAASPTAYLSGAVISYSSQGHSYTHVTPWFMGQSRVCPPLAISRSQMKRVYLLVTRSKDPKAAYKKLSEADKYLFYLATKPVSMHGSSSMKLVSPPP